MRNEIELLRDRLEKEFDPAFIIPKEHGEADSPCGRYRLSTDAFGTAANPTFPAIVVAVIREIETGEAIATIRRNDNRLFYSWISRDGHDYLLFPEDLEGQSVVDLTERRVAGFAAKDGDFIWTEFYPSPDKMRLAILGCYWACPLQVTVYDFREPMTSPLPTIAQFDLPANAKFGEWLSTNAMTVRDEHGVMHTFEIP